MFNVQEIDTNLNHNMNGPFDRLIFSPAIHQTGEHSPKNINQKDPELIQRIYRRPVGLLAQLVERCRGHEFKSRTGQNFFQVLFTTTRFSSVLSCEDLLISKINEA